MFRMNREVRKMHDHQNEIATVRNALPSETDLGDLASLFRIFGDRTRIRILFSLFESELCVCALCELLDIEQSAVSHQLKILKDAGLVANRREGKTVFYRLADDHVRTIIGQGFEHLTEGI